MDQTVPVERHVAPATVFRWAVAAGLGLFVVLLGALALYTLREVLTLAFVAIFVAVSLDPAVRWLVRHGWKRGWAVGFIFLIAAGAVAGVLAAVMPPLIEQATRLSTDLPGYVSQASAKSESLSKLAARYGITQQLDTLAKELPGRIGSMALSTVTALFGALFAGIIITVLTIYFMIDLPRFRIGLVKLFPRAHRPTVHRTVDIAVDKVGSYMIGNLIISLIAGVTAFVALLALGVPFALPLAVLVAVTDLIPLIGATVGAVVCLGVALATVNIWPQMIMLGLFFLLYQQLENYVIAPRVLRNAVDLPAVAVLLAGLVGGTLLGLPGALMAIPIAAVIKVVSSPDRERRRRRLPVPRHRPTDDPDPDLAPGG